MRARLLALTACLALVAPALAACGNDGPSITVYNAQHEELLNKIVPIFEKKTGIDVKLRSGSDLELANQIVQEGDASPADVFLTENSPAMALVDSKGLFSTVDQDTQSLIPAQFQPSDHKWIGFLGRSTVAVYNTDKLTDADMPSSILDFARPEWKGRVAFSPTGA